MKPDTETPAERCRHTNDMFVTHSDLLAQLKTLHQQMREVGNNMQHLQPHHDLLAMHGQELLGVAHLVKSWADGFEKELAGE